MEFLLLAETTNGGVDWGTLIAVFCAILVPTAGAWVGLYVQVATVKVQLKALVDKIEERKTHQQNEIEGIERRLTSAEAEIHKLRDRCGKLEHKIE